MSRLCGSAGLVGSLCQTCVARQRWGRCEAGKRDSPGLCELCGGAGLCAEGCGELWAGFRRGGLVWCVSWNAHWGSSIFWLTFTSEGVSPMPFYRQENWVSESWWHVARHTAMPGSGAWRHGPLYLATFAAIGPSPPPLARTLSSDQYSWGRFDMFFLRLGVPASLFPSFQGFDFSLWAGQFQGCRCDLHFPTLIRIFWIQHCLFHGVLKGWHCY